MIKGAIFDFNGTLYDDSAIHTEVWRQIYEDLTEGKGDFSKFEDGLIGSHNKTLIDRIYAELGKDISLKENDRLSEYKEELYRKYSIEHDLCHLITGAERLLDEMKERGIKLILCSASIAANIDFFFKEFHIGRWFLREDVVYDDGTCHDKRKMYIEAARRIAVPVEECLIFEDSDYGASCALANKAKVILIDKTRSKKKIDGIIQIVKNYDEVDRHLIFD